MILASAIAYSDTNLSFDDFLSRIPQLCLKTLATSFHLILFTIGYIGLFSALLISLMIVTMDHPLVLMPVVITYGLFASIFWMYFAFIWDIALVISVMEKSCCGLQALGKAGGLVKGNRLHGLALSFSYTMVTVIICMSFRGNPNQKQCKKTHGEEIELQGSLEYSRIRNDRGGTNLKPVLVKLFFAKVIYLLLKLIMYRLIFQSKSSDSNDPMFERTLASGGN
ncbi:hypothetical protein RHGRI_000097 [Rhododendron griersonianum]|uniref:Uncharacterized protein n=1 Tax=Rhododendron griersonianum TaxID=479676 RepID=A0AAV6LF90_9ERIC|nr:hypothetical protein RHGRI_000097 [Rhododendron griersonianum]